MVGRLISSNFGKHGRKKGVSDRIDFRRKEDRSAIPVGIPFDRHEQIHSTKCLVEQVVDLSDDIGTEDFTVGFKKTDASDGAFEIFLEKRSHSDSEVLFSVKNRRLEPCVSVFHFRARWQNLALQSFAIRSQENGTVEIGQFSKKRNVLKMYVELSVHDIVREKFSRRRSKNVGKTKFTRCFGKVFRTDRFGEPADDGFLHLSRGFEIFFHERGMQIGDAKWRLRLPHEYSTVHVEIRRFFETDGSARIEFRSFRIFGEGFEKMVADIPLDSFRVLGHLERRNDFIAIQGYRNDARDSGEAVEFAGNPLPEKGSEYGETFRSRVYRPPTSVIRREL